MKRDIKEGKNGELLNLKSKYCIIVVIMVDHYHHYQKICYQCSPALTVFCDVKALIQQIHVRSNGKS